MFQNHSVYVYLFNDNIYMPIYFSQFANFVRILFSPMFVTCSDYIFCLYSVILTILGKSIFLFQFIFIYNYVINAVIIIIKDPLTSLSFAIMKEFSIGSR